MSETTVRFWIRPRRDAGERARYSLLLDDAAAPAALLAYGDAEDVASPRVTLYRHRRRHPLRPTEIAVIERRLRGNGYEPAERAPVAWLDRTTVAGAANLDRLAATASGREPSISLEPARDPARRNPANLAARAPLLGQIEVDGESIELLRTSYADGALAVIARGADGSPFGTLSVNLPGEPLPDDCFAVKTWSENRALAEAALRSGLFEATGERLPTGFVQAPVWRIR